MSLEVPKTIEVIGNAIDSVSDCIKTSKIHQSEMEIIREKRKLKKAVNIAEKMFKITSFYLEAFSDDDKRAYNRLYYDFIKYD